jgi:hypothetical protein
MTALRALLRHKRLLTMLVIALALCVKALLPAGYMLGTGARMLTVQLCTESTGEHRSLTIAVPQSGGESAPQDMQKKAESPCAFSALGWAFTGDVPAPLLALAILFALALGFAPVVFPALSRVHFAQPPLRGPPLPA